MRLRYKPTRQSSVPRCVRSRVKTGDVIYSDPMTHWAENIGDTTIRLVLVELKS